MDGSAAAAASATARWRLIRDHDYRAPGSGGSAQRGVKCILIVIRGQGNSITMLIWCWWQVPSWITAVFVTVGTWLVTDLYICGRVRV